MCSEPLAHKNLASLFLPWGLLKSSKPGSKNGYKAAESHGPTGSRAGAHWHFQCKGFRLVSQQQAETAERAKLSKDQT